MDRHVLAFAYSRLWLIDRLRFVMRFLLCITSSVLFVQSVSCLRPDERDLCAPGQACVVGASFAVGHEFAQFGVKQT